MSHGGLESPVRRHRRAGVLLVRAVLAFGLVAGLVAVRSVPDCPLLATTLGPSVAAGGRLVLLTNGGPDAVEVVSVTLKEGGARPVPLELPVRLDGRGRHALCRLPDGAGRPGRALATVEVRQGAQIHTVTVWTP